MSDDGKYVSLDKLKGDKDDQNYAIPAGVHLTDYTSVAIWCDRFDVSSGAATRATGLLVHVRENRPRPPDGSGPTRRLSRRGVSTCLRRSTSGPGTSRSLRGERGQQGDSGLMGATAGTPAA